MLHETIIKILILDNQRLRKKLNHMGSIDWLPTSVVANMKAMTVDGVRKQLQNGDFEEDLDFKRKGSRILISQGAVGRIQRKRRSSNG